MLFVVVVVGVVDDEVEDDEGDVKRGDEEDG